MTMNIANRTVVLNGERVEQIGARVANHFAAGFISSPTMNFLDGTTTDQWLSDLRRRR